MIDKNSEQKEAKTPSWVYQATKICSGCHDNFYNFRNNYECNWCYNLICKRYCLAYILNHRLELRLGV